MTQKEAALLEDTTGQRQNHERKAHLLSLDQWLYSLHAVTFCLFQEVTICGSEIREMKAHSASNPSFQCQLKQEMYILFDIKHWKKAPPHTL